MLLPIWVGGGLSVPRFFETEQEVAELRAGAAVGENYRSEDHRYIDSEDLCKLNQQKITIVSVFDRKLPFTFGRIKIQKYL
jgi:hypothetical protein